MKEKFLDYVSDLITYKGYERLEFNNAREYIRIFKECDLNDDILKEVFKENIFLIKNTQIMLKNNHFKKSPFEYSGFVLSILENISFDELFNFVERIYFDYGSEGGELNTYYFLKGVGNYDLSKAKKIKNQSHLQSLFYELETLLINTFESAFQSASLILENATQEL